MSLAATVPCIQSSAPGEAAPDLALVIPVYNEAAQLAALRERIAAVCRKLELDYRLLWVDDCSTDGSREMIRAFHAADPERDRFLFRARNMGIAYAWREAFAQRGRIVGLIPSDGQFAPENLADVLKAFRAGCDAVVVTRPRRKDPLPRAFLSRAAAALERLLLGNPYRDIHWVHFWKGGLLGGVVWRSSTTAIDAEWSHHVRRRVPRNRIITLGLPHHPRAAGKAHAGKASVRPARLYLETLLDLVRTSILARLDAWRSRASMLKSPIKMR